MRVLSVLDRYLVQLRADGRSPYWISQVSRHVRFLDRWLGEHRMPRDVRRVTHEHIARFLSSAEANTRRDGRPKKATSTNALRSSLKVFFAYAQAAGHTSRNAGALIRRARCQGQPLPPLPEADCKRLLSTLAAADGPAAERDSLLFNVLLTTGIRVGAAVGIDVSDVDLRGGEINLRRMKNDRPVRIAIPKSLRAQLRAAIANRTDGPLFQAQGGRRISGRHVRRRLAFWLAKIGARHAGPHGLRRAFAMRVYRRTGDISRVQSALGHSSVASTVRYASYSAARDYCSSR